jgi:hypothetical protein
VRVVPFIGKSVRVVSLPVTGWLHPVVIAEPGKALTDNDRDRANKIAPTASVIRTIRAWRNGSRGRLKSARVGRLVHVRVVPPGPQPTGSGVSRQCAGLPSRRCGIVARLPVQPNIMPGVAQLARASL